jgi:hypothetical protein
MYQHFIIPYLYEAQHVSDDTPPIIRSLKLHWQPLVFPTCKVVGRVVGGRFRLLMMGGVSPETCWASYKYEIIKFWYIVASCCFFMNCTMMHGSTNIKYYLFVCFLFCGFCVFVLFCTLFLLWYKAVSLLFFLQVYRPLPPGGNTTAVNKYHIYIYIYI